MKEILNEGNAVRPKRQAPRLNLEPRMTRVPGPGSTPTGLAGEGSAYHKSTWLVTKRKNCRLVPTAKGNDSCGVRSVNQQSCPACNFVPGPRNSRKCSQLPRCPIILGSSTTELKIW